MILRKVRKLFSHTHTYIYIQDYEWKQTINIVPSLKNKQRISFHLDNVYTSTSNRCSMWLKGTIIYILKITMK